MIHHGIFKQHVVPMHIKEISTLERVQWRGTKLAASIKD